MKQEIFVLVHEYCIKSSILRLRHNPTHPEYMRALEVASEIERIRSSGATIIPVYRFMASYETPDGLPAPRRSLVLYVMGAYTGLCVQTQRSALIQEGYNVRVHLPGCLEQPSSFNKHF